MTNSVAMSAAAAVIAVVMAVPMTASAQRGGNDRAPRGSYTQSCNEISVSGGRLYAACYNTSSQRRSSSLDLSGCGASDVSNDDGLLICASQRGRWERGNQGGNNGGGWNGDRPGSDNNRAPRGSYEQSCNEISVSRGRLNATCRDTRSNRRASSLDLSRCGRSDVANDNGLLICGSQRGEWERGNDGGNSGGGWSGGRPGGGNNGGGWGGNNGRSTITVYSDSNFRGERATFQGEVYNLSSTGLNDAISSMEIRGQWEVCTDSNFRGSCQVFDGDVRNFGSSGYNDRISSIRPVRRGW